MTAPWNRQPYMALVDNDPHSARLLTRMLLAHGAPSIRWMETAQAATTELATLLASRHGHVPDLLIVDLKDGPQASREFIAMVRALPRSHQLMIAALAPALERHERDALFDAGADAVFERHADVESYREEAAGIVSFWVRSHRLDAVGS